MSPRTRNLAIAGALCVPLVMGLILDQTRWSHHTVGFHEPPGMIGELLFQEHTVLSVREGNASRPFLTDKANHPWGQDLGFAVANSAHLYLYATMRTVLGPFQSYNAVALLVTLLNFLAFAWLARGFFPSRAVALCAALLFAATPYLLLKLNLGFIHKYVVLWIPLYGLALLRLWETRRHRYLAWAVVTLFLMQITYPPYAMYAGLFTALLVTFAVLGRREPKFALSRFAALVVLFVALSLLYYRALGFDLEYFRGMREFGELGVIPEGCVNLFNPFYFHPYAWDQHPTELPLGISVTAFALAVVGVVMTKGPARWLFALFAVFMVLAAGPYLRGPDDELVRLGGNPIRLPFYYLARHVPLAGGIKFAMRLMPFAIACLALCAGYGLQALGRQFQTIGVVRLSAVCAFVFVAELLVLFHDTIPPAAHEVAMPEFFEEVRDDDSFDAILNLPHSRERPQINRYGFYTYVARKAMVNPYSAEDLSIVLPDASDAAVAKAAFLDELAGWRVGYIVVHERFLGEDGDEGTEAHQTWLRQMCEETRYPEDGVVVYRIPTRSPAPAQRSGPRR